MINKTLKTLMAVVAFALVMSGAHAQTILDNHGNTIGRVEEDMFAKDRRLLDQIILEQRLQRIEENTRHRTTGRTTTGRTRIVRSVYLGTNKEGQAVYQDGNGERSVYLGTNKEGQPVFQDENGQRYVAFQGKKPGTEIHVYSN
jgi:uncharacterized lipoprotein NlpE involved in copper resistance